jgi:hypothetical protein
MIVPELAIDIDNSNSDYIPANNTDIGTVDSTEIVGLNRGISAVFN